MPKYKPEVPFSEISKTKLVDISSSVLKNLSTSLYGIDYYSFGKDPKDPTSILVEIGIDGMVTNFGIKASFAIAVKTSDITSQVVRSLVSNMRILQSNVEESKT